jgi:ATP-dependent Clp protease ATP-binding subunit ClpA
MARLIQDTIRRALADELLFGKLANGGRVTIDLDENGQVKLDIAQSAQQPPEPVESA